MFGQLQGVQFGASCQNKVIAEECQSFRVASRLICSADCFFFDHRVGHYHVLVVVVLRRIAYLFTSVRCRDSRTELTSCVCVAENARRVYCCRSVEMVAHWSRF